jgi:hypothetical protein
VIGRAIIGLRQSSEFSRHALPGASRLLFCAPAFAEQCNEKETEYEETNFVKQVLSGERELIVRGVCWRVPYLRFPIVSGKRSFERLGHMPKGSS